nr:MAG TPA: hypothetical protein [Caudoviricetes sp.]
MLQGSVFDANPLRMCHSLSENLKEVTGLVKPYLLAGRC